MMKTGYPLQIQYITLYFSTAPVYVRMSFSGHCLTERVKPQFEKMRLKENQFDVVLVTPLIIFFSQ